MCRTHFCHPLLGGVSCLMPQISMEWNYKKVTGSTGKITAVDSTLFCIICALRSKRHQKVSLDENRGERKGCRIHADKRRSIRLGTIWENVDDLLQYCFDKDLAPALQHLKKEIIVFFFFLRELHGDMDYRSDLPASVELQECQSQPLAWDLEMQHDDTCHSERSEPNDLIGLMNKF